MTGFPKSACAETRLRKTCLRGRRNRRACSFLLSASLLALFSPFPVGRALGEPGVVRHDLFVRLDPGSRFLSAEDALTVRPDGESPLVFSLSAGADVDFVVAGGRKIPFSRAGETVRVELPPDLAEDGHQQLTISYRGKFDDPVPEDPVNTEDPSYGVRATIGIRGTFLGSGSGWYPEIEGSRPTFRVVVEGPAGYEAVTAGRLVRRETASGVTRSEWETREPHGSISLSAGPYVVREGKSGGIPLFTYFYPETDALSGKYREAAGRYLELYRNLLGPYPFEKFAVVENFFPTGYGFPSYTLLGSTVIRLPFILDTSLGHEVAHSWWGNGVRVDYSLGNWSEGLTTYLADHLYKERSSEAEGREYRLKVLRDYAALVTRENDFPLASFIGRDSPASRAIGYGKAAMVFHMARRRAGDDAFWNGLRRVVRDRMYREATWDDFARAIGQESGIDFLPFFRQWVKQTGAPVIGFSGIRANRIGKEWRISGIVTQEEPYLDLRIPLCLSAEQENIDAVVEITGKEARFFLMSGSRPIRLVADPDVDLFRRLDASEIPPSVNGIRGSSDLLVVVARGIPADLLESSKLLLAALGKENAAILREEETPPSRLAGHDVLFLGLPEGKGYLPVLPKDLSVSGRWFALRGEKFESSGDSLFVVLPHPSDGKRVAALFLALSPEAAAKSARKIPHYGTYSFLAFSAGTNRVKGTWEMSASPTVHEFPSGEGSGEVPAIRGR